MGRTLLCRQTLTNFTGDIELFANKIDGGGPGPGPGQPVYEFDGATMCATIPTWRPLGFPFEVSVEALPLTVDSASNQQVLANETANSQYHRINATTNVLQHSYRFNDTNVLLASGVAAVVGENLLSVAMHAADGAVYSVNGTEVTNPNPVDIGDVRTNIKHIAAGNTAPADPFNGQVWNVRLTDNSPIQDTDAGLFNGTRRITVPQMVIPAGNDFTIRCHMIRRNGTGTGQQGLFGQWVNTAQAIILADTGHGSANRIRCTINGTNADITGAFDNVAIGQHVKLEIQRRSGTIEAFIDGVSVGTSITPANGELVIDSFGNVNGAPGMPSQSSMQEVEIIDEGVNPAIRYYFPINEGEGTAVYNRDPLTGQPEGAAAVASEPAIRAGILWYGGSETDWTHGSSGDDSWAQKDLYPPPNEDECMQQVEHTKYAGNRAYWAYIEGAWGKWTSNDTYRAELAKPGGIEFQLDQEYWIGGALFIADTPNNRAMASTEKINASIWQIHGKPSGSGHIHVRYGQYEFAFGNHSKQFIKPVQFGRWVPFVLNFKFSRGASGFVKMWLDQTTEGTPDYQRTGSNMWGGSDAGYMKMGHYRSFIHDDNTSDGTYTYVSCGYDEFRIGDENSDFQSVLPVVEAVEPGQWTPDADWQQFPGRSRFYPMDDESATLACYTPDGAERVPEHDGTIVNHNPDNWG